MNNIIFKIKSFSCISCLDKLENKIIKIDNIASVNINIISSKINVKLKNEEKDPVIQKILYEANILNISLEDIDNKKVVGKDVYKSLKIKSIPFFVGFILYILAIFNFFSNFNSYIFIFSYILISFNIILKVIKNIFKGKVFDENFLMTIATIGAISIGEYKEAVAVMIFYKIGEFLHSVAVNNSKDSIKELMNIKPEFANLVDDKNVYKVPPEKVNVDNIILVKPGEKVALDGIVIEGESYIDTSSITGESVNKLFKVGDEILSGTINLTSIIKIRVQKSYKNSTVSKIIDMVQNASSKKSEPEKFITSFSKIYTPIVIFLAILISVLPPLIMGTDFNSSLYKGLVFLVVSCPCALVVSIPLTFFSGIGSASKKGVLVKGSNYLQKLSEIDTIVFDKTGTLTKGVFKVTYIKPKEGIEVSELLLLTALLETFSNHPIGIAIINECNRKNLNLHNDKVEKFEEIAGKGLKGYVSDEEILVGNYKLMKLKKIDYENYEGLGTVIHVAKNNNYLGYIVVSDIIKEETKSAIEKFKNDNLDVYMLTGDRKEEALKVSKILGIENVYSDLLPHEKVNIIEELYKKDENKKIAFVGDGINDAPVLSRVDIGISMGGVGSDVAIESSDVVIMTDELYKITEAISISKNTMKIVKENIVLALGIKFIIMVLVILGLANMWMAVFADVGVTLIAIINSMRKKY